MGTARSGQAHYCPGKIPDRCDAALPRMRWPCRPHERPLTWPMMEREVWRFGGLEVWRFGTLARCVGARQGDLPNSREAAVPNLQTSKLPIIIMAQSASHGRRRRLSCAAKPRFIFPGQPCIPDAGTPSRPHRSALQHAACGVRPWGPPWWEANPCSPQVAEKSKSHSFCMESTCRGFHESLISFMLQSVILQKGRASPWQ